MLSILGSRSCFVGSRFYPHCPSPSAASVQIPAVHVYLFQGGTHWGQNGSTLTDVWVSLHINCSGSNTVSHIVSSHDPGSAQIATSEKWERIVHIGRSYYLEDRIFWPWFATMRPTQHCSPQNHYLHCSMVLFTSFLPRMFYSGGVLNFCNGLLHVCAAFRAIDHKESSWSIAGTHGIIIHYTSAWSNRNFRVLRSWEPQTSNTNGL